MSRQSVSESRQSLALGEELYVATEYLYRDRVRAKGRRFLVAIVYFYVAT